jgi:RNA-binding protein 5/10
MDTGAMNPAKQTSPTESRGIKQSKAAYDADIAKWNHARSINAYNSKASDSPDTEATNIEPISAPKTTKTGQPVCLLCRRKFPNIEALQKHEQSSALHKQNLAKKDKDAAETSKSTWTRPDNPSGEYRDRAKDRRSMYGADVSGAVPSVASSECSPGAIISSASADFGPNLERARAVAATATVRPSDAFGDSNLGKQLLQKIGWKKGSSLGRKKSLETRDNSDGTSDRPEGSDANIQMLKEWEKIESAAAAPPTASSSFRSAREGGTSSSRRAGIGNNKGERYM